MFFANHNRKAENSQNLVKEWHFEQTKNCLLTHFFTTHHSPMWKTLGPLTIITYKNVNISLITRCIWWSLKLQTTDKGHQLSLVNLENSSLCKNFGYKKVQNLNLQLFLEATVWYVLKRPGNYGYQGGGDYFQQQKSEAAHSIFLFVLSFHKECFTTYQSQL